MIKTLSLTALISILAFLFLLSFGAAQAQGNQPTLDAAIIATSQSHTIDPNPAQDPDSLPPLAIGEIVTFEVIIAVPNGPFSNLILEDRLERGLTFVAIDSVVASADLQTNAEGGFAGVASNAVIRNMGEEVEDHGRLLRIDLGDLSSVGENSIRLVYSAVVINSEENHHGNGSRRGNGSQLFVDGLLADSAIAEAYIVEPLLDFTLTADPAFGDPGDTVHFVLEVAHDIESNADAMNGQATIVLPDDLMYVPGTLRWTEIGRKPARVNDSNASSLRVVWSDIGTRQTSFVEFSAIIRSDLPAGLPVAVPLRATWTSLPGSTEIPLSLHNALAVERTGNSSDIGGVANTYRVREELFVATPFHPAIKTLVATSSAQTGPLNSGIESDAAESISIGEVGRFRLAMRLDEGEYHNVEIIENLPEGMAYINDKTAKIAFVANERGITSSIISGDGLSMQGNDSLAKPTFVLPASAITEFAGSPAISIQLGTVENADSDGDAEYIIVEFNALVLNREGNSAGKELTNTFDLIDGDLTTSNMLASSNELSVRVIEPTLTISNLLTIKPAKIGDLVQYQVTVASIEGADKGAAYDVIITDILDTNITVQEVRIDPASTVEGTVTVGEEVVTVRVAQIMPGERLTFVLDAVVSDAIAEDVSVQNQAMLQYATSPTDAGVQNPTGSIPTEGTQRTYTDSTAAEIFFIEGPRGESQLRLTNRDTLLVDADGNGQASAGDTVRYTVEIENNGAFVAKNLSMFDHLPTSVTLLPNSIESTNGRIVTSFLTTGLLANDAIDTTRTVAIELETLAPQQVETVTFDVVIGEVLDDGMIEIANQAIIFGENITVAVSDDPETLARNDATLLLLTETPRLHAVNSIKLVQDGNDDGLPSAGDVVEHCIIIANEGTGDAPGVVVDDLIDLNMHVLTEAVHTSQGAVQLSHANGGDALHVDVGTMAAGARVTITFQSRVNNPLLETVQQVANQAIVSSKLQPPVLTDDPNTPTPEDATVLSLSAAPALQSSMIALLVADRDQNGYASYGDVIAYQVVIANSGQEPATDVSFSNTLPTITTVVSGTARASNGSTIQVDHVGISTQSSALEEPNSDTIHVDVGELRGDSSTIVSFLLEVDADAPRGLALLQNQGSVQSRDGADLLTDSPVINGQVDPTTIVLNEKPYLILTMRDLLLHDGDGNRILSRGDQMIYLLNVTNIGNAPASDLILEDLPHIGTALSVGTAQSDRGDIITGNVVGSRRLIASIVSLPAQNRTVAAYQVMLAANTQVDLIENQAMLTFNDPILRTQNSIDSDDPDTKTAADPTVTLVFIEPTAIDGGVEPDARLNIYLPITLK